jgi:hypothetical protein
MLDPKPIYCQVAIFQCTCCGYEAEIYADYEWMERRSGQECTKCHSSKNDHFEFAVVHRSDICEDVVPHPTCIFLPKQLQNCEKCISRDRIHWTELLAYCQKCKKSDDDAETMVFKNFTEGKYREYFYKLCEEWAKPEHPWMPFFNADGSHYYSLNGPTSKISAN